MAGVLQSPSSLRRSTTRPCRSGATSSPGDGRCRFHHGGRRLAASREPLVVVQRALEAEAPHFVDYVTQTIDEDYPGLTTTTDQAVDVYTTLDLHLQRIAQDAVRAA